MSDSPTNITAAEPTRRSTSVRTPKEKEDRHFVTALARGLEVLACFRNGEATLSTQELSTRCQLPKSTVSRLTMTLTRLGYLIHVKESGRYRLGTACLALGSALLARLDVRKIARPLMQELAHFSGASVSLGVRDKLSMIYVENCRSQAALTLTLDVGSRIPLATSAMGRAWLVTAPADERAQALQQLSELDNVTWPSLEAGLEKAQEDYRTLGVTCSWGEWLPEVNGIARAFSPGNSLPMMSINIGGPAYQLTSDFLLNEVRPRLLDVARSLEDSLPR